MKASYLSSAEIVKYIDSLTLRTLFVRMKILNKEERVLKTIEGRATGGSISINASSSVRRTGSITLVTGDSSYEKDEELKTLYKVTEIDNLISMNKRVEIEIGLKNTGLEYQEYDTFWIPMGQFLITNASVTHNTQGIQIQVKLTDKMALLNGEIGGTIPGAIIHSPYEDLATGEKYQALFFTLIRELVSEIGEIPENKIIIEDIGERIATSAFWKNISSEDNLELVSYEDTNTHTIVYEIKQDNKDYSSLNAVSYLESERIGVLNTDFVFPGKELSSNGGDSVASMLDKIAKELGNFEYFFDLDGNFRFRQIRDYLNEGSNADDLTVAIAEGYFINTSAGKSLYSFTEGVNLVSSYANNPVYSNIKNDYTIWGKKKGTETAIRYHLIIDNKQLFDAEKKELFKNNADEFQVWLATVNDVVQAFPTERAARNSVLTSLGIDPNQSDEVKMTPTFGRWIFNEQLIPEITTAFTSNYLTSKQLSFSLQQDEKQRFIAVRSFLDANNKFCLEYNHIQNGVYTWITAYKDNKWVDEKYKAITFGKNPIEILTSFYNWLTSNATWQEKFITPGFRAFKSTIGLAELESSNIQFSLYDITTNKPTITVFYGVWVHNDEVDFKSLHGDWIPAYKDNKWVDKKYQYIYFDANYHVDDKMYKWFNNNSTESKTINGKFVFNNIIDLTDLQWSEENISDMCVFEPEFGTYNNYSKSHFQKIFVEDGKLKVYADFDQHTEIMYSPTEGWQAPKTKDRYTKDTFQYIQFRGTPVVSKSFYEWLYKNAKEYSTPYVTIDGRWELINKKSFDSFHGYTYFNFTGYPKRVDYNYPFTIIEKTRSYLGHAFSIASYYNESLQRNIGPILEVTYSQYHTYTTTWFDENKRNWRPEWEYIEFDTAQRVTGYFYNWFTRNFKPVTEEVHNAATYNVRQNQQKEAQQEYIKAGEVWELKQDPWKFTNKTLNKEITTLAMIYDKLHEKVYEDTEVDEIKFNNGGLSFGNVEIYTAQEWKIANPIVIKFIEPVTDPDFFNVWQAIAQQYSSVSTIPVATQYSISESLFNSFDWRVQKYYYYVMTLDTSYLGKEIKENIPKLLNIKTGAWRSQNGADQEYFIDMIDLNDVMVTEDNKLIGTIDSDTGKKYVSKSGYDALAQAYEFAVHKIQRRTKVINSQEVNCLFRTGQNNNNAQVDWANSVFILNKNDPSLNIEEINLAEDLQNEAELNGQTPIAVSKEVFDRLSVFDEETPAYDLLRAQLHEFLSYNENINLTTVPVYHLDVNTRISVEDEKSDIHGDYIIQSIQIPLTINGNMTINAKRAIERI